jgi:hypothetical protein
VSREISGALLPKVAARMEKWDVANFDATRIPAGNGVENAVAAWRVNDHHVTPPSEAEWAQYMQRNGPDLHGIESQPIVSAFMSDEKMWIVCNSPRCNLYGALCKHQYFLNNRQVALHDIDVTKCRHVLSGAMDAYRMRDMVGNRPVLSRYHKVLFTGDIDAHGAVDPGPVDGAGGAGGAGCGSVMPQQLPPAVPITEPLHYARFKFIPPMAPTTSLEFKKMMTNAEAMSNQVPGSIVVFREQVHRLCLDQEAFITQQVAKQRASAGNGAMDRNPNGSGSARQHRFFSLGEHSGCIGPRRRRRRPTTTGGNGGRGGKKTRRDAAMLSDGGAAPGGPPPPRRRWQCNGQAIERQW